MAIYIAFLRGINVSGQKKIQMAALRSCLEKLGFSGVATYIQSGNVLFKSAEESTKAISEAIHSAIQREFGYEVPVLVTDLQELKSIVEQCPFGPEELEKGSLYYVLLQTVPHPQLVSEFYREEYENERCLITGRCGYLLCFKGMGEAKLNNNLIERKLKVSATTRNQRTILKLIEMAEGL